MKTNSLNTNKDQDPVDYSSAETEQYDTYVGQDAVAVKEGEIPGVLKEQ